MYCCITVSTSRSILLLTPLGSALLRHAGLPASATILVTPLTDPFGVSSIKTPAFVIVLLLLFYCSLTDPFGVSSIKTTFFSPLVTFSVSALTDPFGVSSIKTLNMRAPHTPGRIPLTDPFGVSSIKTATLLRRCNSRRVFSY